MHREMLAIDLPGVIAVARAQNLDVLRARQEVEASKGRYQSTVGSALPALTPGTSFEHVDGTVRASEGNLIGVGFETFQVNAAVQWITNPGQVIYEAIAAKKRLSASERQEQAVIIETLRLAADQYWELVLAQTRVTTAREAVAEAEELLRINQLRERVGTGVPADVLRAEARLAEHQQDLVTALNGFYDTSVVLAVTLRLDSSVTLVPKMEQLPATTLVRQECTLDELLEYALAYRPDLKAVRSLVEAAAASKGATWWGDFGPQFQVGYQYGGITGHADNVTPGQGISSNLIVNPLTADGSFVSNPVANGIVKEGISRASQRAAGSRDGTYSFSDQQRLTAGAGWHLSLAAIGDLKTAGAVEQQEIIEAERRLEQARAQVIVAREASRATAQLIPLTQRQLTSAEEAYRLTQANLEAGTMTLLDVLQAEDVVDLARLRRAEAVVRYNQSQVDLLASLGLLEPGAFLESTRQTSAEVTSADEAAGLPTDK